FSGHVRNLVAILGSATERSLVLLDEVAAGTDPEEGSALAQALLERLAGQARLTVVTTHYPELKEWASARAGVANAATGYDVEAELAEARAEIAALRDEVRTARRARRAPDQDRALGAATERAARAERVLSQHKVEPLEATEPLAEGDPVEAPDVGVRGTIVA